MRRTVAALAGSLLVITVLAGPAGGSPSQLCFGKRPTIVGNGHVRGTAHADVILTGAGNDRVDGGGGNDRICAGAGDDLVEGGTGSDRIETTLGDDQVHGGNGSDLVLSGQGADTLIGNRGNDRLFAGAGGRDFADGGLGDDTVAGGPGPFDQVTGSVGNDKLFGGGGDGDVLRGARGGDTLDGGPGAHDAASYAVAGASGEMAGGRGVEVDLFNGTARNDGEDRLRGIEDVIGTAFADVLRGDASANVLYGAGGSDRLEGSGAGDVAAAGLGRDRCGGFAVEDSCEEHGFGGGAPVVDEMFEHFGAAPPARLEVDLAGGPGATGLTVVAPFSYPLRGGPGVQVSVSFEDDAWKVAASGLPIEAGDACQALSGAAVVCPVAGRPDAVLLSGTVGNDKLEVADSVPATVSALIEGETGADQLIGGPGDDSLVGNGYPQEDSLYGRGGDDALSEGRLLSGGAGSDLLIAYPCAGEVVDGGGGVDSVSFARLTGFAGVEARIGGEAGLPRGSVGLPDGGCPAVPGFAPTLISPSIESIEGSTGDDVLIGDGARNILLGRGGDDRVEGKGGGDFLVGGTGRDALLGGAGADRLYAVDSRRDAEVVCGDGPDGGVAFTDPQDPPARACRERRTRRHGRLVTLADKKLQSVHMRGGSFHSFGPFAALVATGS